MCCWLWWTMTTTEFVFCGRGREEGTRLPPSLSPYIMTFMASSLFKPRQPKMCSRSRSGAFFQSHAAMNLLLTHAVSRPSPSIPSRSRPLLRPVSPSSAAGPTSCILPPPALPLRIPSPCDARDAGGGDEHDGRGCVCGDESTSTPFPYQA